LEQEPLLAGPAREELDGKAPARVLLLIKPDLSEGALTELPHRIAARHARRLGMKSAGAGRELGRRGLAGPPPVTPLTLARGSLTPGVAAGPVARFAVGAVVGLGFFVDGPPGPPLAEGKDPFQPNPRGPPANMRRHPRR